MFLLFMRRALVGASLVMMTLPIVSAQDSTVLHRADTMTALTTPPSSMVTSNPRPSATLNDGSSVSISCPSQSDGDDCIVVAGGETETMAEDSGLQPAHTTSLISSSTLAASTTYQSSDSALTDSTFPFPDSIWSILPTTAPQTSATPETTEIGRPMSFDSSMGPYSTTPSDAASISSLYSSLVASTTMPTSTGTDASFVTSVGPHETEALTPAPTKSRPQTWLIVLSIGCAMVTLALVALVVRCLWRRRARNLVEGSVMPFDADGDVDEKPCLSARQLAMSMSSLADAKHRLRTPSIIGPGNRGAALDALPPEMLFLSGNDTKNTAGATGMQYSMLSNGVNGRLSIDPAAHTLLDRPAVADAAYRDTLSRRLSTTASRQLSPDHVEVVEPSAVVLPSIQPSRSWSCIHHSLAPLPDHLSQQGRRHGLSALTPSAVGVRPARPLPPTPTPTLPFTHVPQPLPAISAHQYNDFQAELGTHLSSAQQPSGPSPTQWAMIHQGAFVATFPGRTPRRRAEDGGVRLAGGLPRWQRVQGGAQGEESNARGSSGSAGGYSDETLPPEYGAY